MNTLEETKRKISRSILENQVNGYLEFGGEIQRISSFKELKAWVKRIETKVMELPKEVEMIKKLNCKNEKLIKSQNKKGRDNSIIDLHKTENYDATKLSIWSFRKSEDERDDIKINLGNMCKGYVFNINGETFYNSETAYIAGMFSDNSEEHKSIQRELQNEVNGYAAKKQIRKRNEHLKRDDWNEFNVQWMLFVVWQKCITNKDFKELLTTQIPADAQIIENSTHQKGDTATFWGASNKELEESRDKIQDLILFLHPRMKQKELKQLQMVERNKINCIGSFTGVNCMGKILKLCQLALLNGTEPPIDYQLLKEKNIYLFGELLSFEKDIAYYA